jgi:hypothetical protein
MKKTLIIILGVAVLVFIITHPISGLNSESIVRLKEAGVSDTTIQIMVFPERYRPHYLWEGCSIH